MMRPATPVGRGLAAALLLAGLCACTTSQNLGAMEAHQAMGLASRALGGSRDLVLVMIPSRGPEADAAYMEQARTNGPTAMASQVADYFSAAVIGPRAYAMVGRNSGKTAQVLCDALALNRGRALGKLTVVFLGSQEHAAAVEEAGREAGAHVVAVTYPPAPASP